MTWDPTLNMFTALGIPNTPFDDHGITNTYPLMRLKAKNANGATLATVDVVLPVSSEVDCRGCHASGSNAAGKPAAGWVRDPNRKRDHRLNILRLHDEKSLANPVCQAALTSNSYLATELYDTVAQNQTPILCAKCHASEALSATGYPGVKSLTASLHGYHAHVVDPKTGERLNASTNRTSCYQCHSGSTTKCLRGAMGSAIAPDGSMEMQCQSCHGRMRTVGNPARTGWLDEPNCQSCHTGTATSNNGQIAYTSAFDHGTHVRVAVNQTFATNPDTPAAGKSLYRFSTGHCGMQCEACHGSTHAEFPTWTRNDNITSKELQGHKGKLSECTACHAAMPSTVTGGPHGLHPMGQSWVSQHQGVVKSGGAQACQSCHGAHYRGTDLTRAGAARTFTVEDGGTKTFAAGQTIGCYDCHNGPGGGDGNGRRATRAPLRATGGSLILAMDQPKSIDLRPTGSGPVTVRIVSQPEHGKVGLEGDVATYFPDAGYVGADSFTFAASNGFVESNLGATNIRVAGLVNGVADLVPPTITPSLPVTRARVQGPAFTVTGTAADRNGIASVEFRIGIAPWQEASGTSTWSAAITGVDPGRVTISFRERDAAGNESAVIQRAFTVF